MNVIKLVLVLKVYSLSNKAHPTFFLVYTLGHIEGHEPERATPLESPKLKGLVWKEGRKVLMWREGREGIFCIHIVQCCSFILNSPYRAQEPVVSRCRQTPGTMHCLYLNIYSCIVLSQGEPSPVACSKPCLGRGCPLQGSPFWIPGEFLIPFLLKERAF